MSLLCTGNVHQVVYSLLLLNTDLHIAELSSHMTKQQFLSNTIGTLERPAHLPSSNSTSNPVASSSSGRPSTSSTPVRSASPAPIADDVLEHGRSLADPLATIKSKRSGSMHSWKAASGSAVHLSAPIGSPSVNVSSASIGEIGLSATPLSSLGRKHGNGQGSISGIQLTKGWEAEVESYLKVRWTWFRRLKGVVLIRNCRKFIPMLRNSKSSSPFLPRECSLLAVLHSAVDFHNDGLGMTGLLTSNEGASAVYRVSSMSKVLRMVVVAVSRDGLVLVQALLPPSTM
jgi:hypothetical protein